MMQTFLRILIVVTTSALPFGIAILIDRDLGSAAHLPIIGISGVCVSLCDALCGQIISNTRWIPFSACHTPAEAQRLVAAFRKYHRRMIIEWMSAKCTSAIVVMITAIMALNQCPVLFHNYRFYVLAIGYILMGFALTMATSFICSYFSATDESDRAKLREMNYAYKKEHPELYVDDSETVKKQLAGFAAGYTSHASTAKTV